MRSCVRTDRPLAARVARRRNGSCGELARSSPASIGRSHRGVLPSAGGAAPDSIGGSHRGVLPTAGGEAGARAARRVRAAPGARTARRGAASAPRSQPPRPPRPLLGALPGPIRGGGPIVGRRRKKGTVRAGVHGVMESCGEAGAPRPPPPRPPLSASPPRPPLDASPGPIRGFHRSSGDPIGGSHRARAAWRARRARTAQRTRTARRARAARQAHLGLRRLGRRSARRLVPSRGSIRGSHRGTPLHLRGLLNQN